MVNQMIARVKAMLMTTTIATVLIAGCIFTGMAHANINSVVGLNNPQLVGEARLRVMLWNVFDAALYSETGSYDENDTFALDLTYLRRLSATSIVDKTMEEFRRLNPDLSAEQASLWKEQLLDIIPDVRKGTNITGVRTADGFTDFYSAGKSLGSVRDREFTQGFFAIWLGKSTAKPGLRKKLIGA